MRDRIDEFEGAVIAAVTFAEHHRLEAHRNHLRVPFPLLADPDRALYQRFELGRGRLRDLYGVGTLRLYAQLLRRGRKLQKPTQDTRQLGGDFVIDPQGRLSAGFWPASPDDRPSIDQLTAAVRASTEARRRR